MFYDRTDAGEKLAKLLGEYQGVKDTLVLGMPRGGVVCAKIVANALNLPLDVIIARKISAPSNPEYAIGAVTSSGEPVLNEEVIGTMGITPDYLDTEIIKQREIINNKLAMYRSKNKLPNIKDKNIIIVDDGMATGYTILAAIGFIKNQKPKSIIVAIPVLPQSIVEDIKKEVDNLIYISVPEEFFAVGQFYEQFEQVSDEDVVSLLR